MTALPFLCVSRSNKSDIKTLLKDQNWNDAALKILQEKDIKWTKQTEIMTGKPDLYHLDCIRRLYCSNHFVYSFIV